MLTDTASVAAHRPRPPGPRRSSANPSRRKPAEGAPAGDVAERPGEELMPPPDIVSGNRRSSSASAASQSSSSAAAASCAIKYEQDLGLDLPQHLTAALERSRRAPEGHGNANRSRTLSPGAERLDSLFVDSASSAPSPSHRGQMDRRRSTPNTEDEHERVKAALPSYEDQNNLERPPSLDYSEDGSEKSLDRDWVGGLPREELEALLVEANKVIKARERDLGIAAAIGKALLEKNMSLRSKHEGILTRLSTSASLSNMLPAGEGPANSPPTSDIHIADDPSHGHFDDETPRPTPRLDGDYFAHSVAQPSDPFVSPTAPRQQQSRPHHSPSSSVSSSRTPMNNLFQQQSQSPSVASALPGYWHSDEGPSKWPSSRSEYFVPSGPPSPSVSRAGVSREQSYDNLARVQAQANEEAQRQLETLSKQNDALLDQLAQLQSEAEEAKKQGGRRLKKLTREIEGLKGELEAATERNVELELEHAGQEDGPRITPPKEKKSWTRKGSMAIWPSSDDGTPSSRGGRSTTADRDQDGHSVHSLEDSKGADARSIRSQSSMTSTLEAGASLAARPHSEGERALVAQLLSKIQELEETNASLTIAGTEMDGRIGRAIEEGERIRDAYEAVETANGADQSFRPASISRSFSSGLGGGSPLQMSPMSSTASASPATAARRAKRRAPGNRYIIEGRRTIRDALRQNIDEEESDPPSSGRSSPTHSRGQRHRMLRPRILITPSTEDLAARRKHDEENGWVDLEASPSQSDTLRSPVRRLNRKQASGVRRVSSDASFALNRQLFDNRGPVASTPPRGNLLAGDFSMESQLDSYGHRREPDLDSLSNISSIVPWQGRRSLQSELVGIADADRDLFAWNEEQLAGQADRSRNDDHGDGGPLQLSDLNNPDHRRLRPQRSASSLRAASEPESDIADLKWSVSSGETVVGRSRWASPAKHQQLQRIAAAPYTEGTSHGGEEEETSAVVHLADGDWLDPEESIVYRGGLRDQKETTGESYDELESATRKAPLHWADDDDFGRPITESEARRLGLMPRQDSTLGNRKRSMLLGWVGATKTKPKSEKGKAREQPRQIESSEAVTERLQTQALLREKRVAALQARLVAGQLTPAKAYAMGLTDEDGRLLAPFPSGTSSFDDSVESEATARALAMSSVRYRRRTLSRPVSPQAVRSKEKTKEGEGGASSSDEAFEMLDLDPARRKKGKRGTDYYPVSYSARYRPAVVKQRVQQASVEAVTWASAWATFSLVMVFAFLVAFSVR